jgi:hypothetical protein
MLGHSLNEPLANETRGSGVRNARGRAASNGNARPNNALLDPRLNAARACNLRWPAIPNRSFRIPEVLYNYV